MVATDLGWAIVVQREPASGKSGVVYATLQIKGSYYENASNCTYVYLYVCFIYI